MNTNNKIDLNTCVPGQSLERRDGTLVSYERKSKFSIDYPHLIGGESYTDDGLYLVYSKDSWDIVKILPLEEIEPAIDLRTCKQGQKVKLRNGTVVRYKKASGLKDYPHLFNNDKFYTDEGCYYYSKAVSPHDVMEILPMECKPVTDLRTCVPGQKLKLRCGEITTYKEASDSEWTNKYPHRLHNGLIYTDEGYYWFDKLRSDNDVMEIFPMEKPKPKLNLNICVPGQKVRLRDGNIKYYTGPIKDGYGGKYTHDINGDSYKNNGCYWSDERESELDVVEILPMEEESLKAPPELTHTITDQIDVTSPDHVSIVPHENGVTISIKKGKATINWRHSNS